MSLLSKLEKLERIATAHDKSASLASDPELIAALGRILQEVITRPELTIHEKIGWHRQEIMNSEASDSIEEPGIFLKPLCQALEPWHRAELARLESEVAKLQ